MIVKCLNMLSGNINQMDLDITDEQYSKFINGDDLVQNIFPNLSSTEREFLISGLSAEEQKEVFG